MNFVAWKAIADERTLQITLQLDELLGLWNPLEAKWPKESESFFDTF